MMSTGLRGLWVCGLWRSGLCNTSKPPALGFGWDIGFRSPSTFRYCRILCSFWARHFAPCPYLNLTYWALHEVDVAFVLAPWTPSEKRISRLINFVDQGAEPTDGWNGWITEVDWSFKAMEYGYAIERNITVHTYCMRHQCFAGDTWNQRCMQTHSLLFAFVVIR